jgi:CheY-like chemotaxis protein
MTLRILVVEDNEDVAWALSALLGKLGHEVVTCACPSAALAAARSLRPDLVLLDLDLPQMDGYTLAMLLRQRGLEQTPMMAVSCQQDDVVRRRAARIDAHYRKPLEFQQLHEILETASAQ